jgi:hypothetical protein
VLRLNHFLYPTNHAAGETHFDAVRMRWGICQKGRNNAFRKPTCALVLFLNDTDAGARFNICSLFPVHSVFGKYVDSRHNSLFECYHDNCVSGVKSSAASALLQQVSWGMH